MRFMIVERFIQGPRPVYERLASEGRSLPDGLVYVDSWIDADLSRCFQLMEAPDAAAFDAWIADWSDLVDFDVVPVLTSAEARSRALTEPST